MFRQEWSGDWNGVGPPLVDAVQAASRAAQFRGPYSFEARLTWNLHGVRARYARESDARERLSYAKPPRWATLRLYTMRPGEEAEFGPATPFDVLEDHLPVNLDLLIVVQVAETQVSITVNGIDEHATMRAFLAGRDALEKHAVTKVPWHMRDNQPVKSSAWTRAIVWIEKHPASVAIVAAVIGVVGVVLGAVLS